jgi:Fur family zinc uptake transcriptional regulator
VTSTVNSLGFHQHDHRACIESALATAREMCAQRSARLTPLREQVLRLVWQSHKPLGAYALLEQLGELAHGERRRLGPPTVYRALEFLLEQGLVHRINSLNAFIGCQHPRDRHQGCFLICRRCESAVETDSGMLTNAVRQAAADVRFEAEGASIEITGLCPECQR